MDIQTIDSFLKKVVHLNGRDYPIEYSILGEENAPFYFVKSVGQTPQEEIRMALLRSDMVRVADSMFDKLTQNATTYKIKIEMLDRRRIGIFVSQWVGVVLQDSPDEREFFEKVTDVEISKRSRIADLLTLFTTPDNGGTTKLHVHVSTEDKEYDSFFSYELTKNNAIRPLNPSLFRSK